jgi:hypothetical protein
MRVGQQLAGLYGSLENVSLAAADANARTANMEATRSGEFKDAARAHATDVVAAAMLLTCASVMAGRVWRFPFDDEVFELTVIERPSILDVMTFSLNGGDNHPPIPHLVFYALHQLGLGPAGMRLFSLAMTALSLALLQVFTMVVIRERTGAAVQPSARIFAVLLFGLSPLAIGQGDVLRWYPMFALMIALFLVMYLVPGRGARLASAIPLGLAASTSFLAVVVALPFLLYRCLLQRAVSRKLDAAYWAIVLLFAAPGMVSAYAIATHKLAHVAATELEHNLLLSAAALGLGFFGGGTVGVGDAWILAPVGLITIAALRAEIETRHPANPTHLLLLVFAGAALMIVVGLDRGRAFLYLAPLLASLLTLFLDRSMRERSVAATVLLLALVLLPGIAVTATANYGTRPFKRNAVIPYAQVLDFIRANEQGETLVMSSDLPLVWVLDHEGMSPQHCVSYFIQRRDCFASDRRYDSLFIISGQSNRSRNAAFMRRVAEKTAEITTGRHKIAQLHAGLDQDAGLKSRLTGVGLDEFILSVDLYR